MPMVKKWLAVPKPGLRPKFYLLYSKPENETEDLTFQVEKILYENCNIC